jgi:hypothetical protein
MSASVISGIPPDPLSYFPALAVISTMDSALIYSPSWVWLILAFPLRVHRPVSNTPHFTSTLRATQRPAEQVPKNYPLTPNNPL